MQRVTSRQNPRLKEAVRLIVSARDRRKAGRCVLEGEHIVGVYAERRGAPETLLVTEDLLARAPARALAERFADRTLVVPTALFAELSVLPAGVGVLAVVPSPHDAPGPPGAFTLLLDDLQDPGNVGSMLRSAAAAGVGEVLLSPHCAFAWAPKVLRAAQGAHFHLRICEGVDLAHWAATFAAGGGRIVATVVDGGTSLPMADLGGRIAVAIGNEGAGLSAALAARATARVTIPMPGGTESLNAAAAAAIVLYECVRQRATGARS
jgi:TrmH family RNA methyltransferase